LRWENYFQNIGIEYRTSLLFNNLAGYRLESSSSSSSQSSESSLCCCSMGNTFTAMCTNCLDLAMQLDEGLDRSYSILGSRPIRRGRLSKPPSSTKPLSTTGAAVSPSCPLPVTATTTSCGPWSLPAAPLCTSAPIWCQASPWAATASSPS
jgi:hypothetical protein